MFSVNIRAPSIDSRADDLGVGEEMAYFGRVSYKHTAVLAQPRAIFLVVVCVWQLRNATWKLFWQCGNRERNPPIIS